MESSSSQWRAAIGVAVVGHGFGAIHVAAFRRNARCKVLALCGRRPEKVRENAELLEIPRATCNWRELLAMRDVDVISLAVPAPAQLEIGLEALAAGKHVFFEKPLADTLEGARQLATLARENQRVTG
jgi:predicted dehydrogenase